MLPVLQEFGVTVLEQPLPPSDIDGLARDHARGPSIPVIADESCRTAEDIPPLVGSGGRHQHQARQVRQPARGAPDDRRGARARHDGDGRLHDRELARHHRRGALHARWWTSSISTVPRCWPTDPFVGARIDGGQVALPDGPGLGVQAR